jgi:hypothetical protein
MRPYIALYTGVPRYLRNLRARKWNCSHKLSIKRNHFLRLEELILNVIEFNGPKAQ